VEYSGDAAAQLAYSWAPVLLLFGDDEEGLGQARAAARRAGCRIAAEAAIAGGAERLEQQIGADAVLLTATAPSTDLDRLLAGLGAAAERGRMRGVVVAPPALIDLIFAADLPSGVDELVDPSAGELEQAIALATEPTPARLNDRNGSLNLLQQLSEDAARIASTLASLSEEDGEAAARDEAAGKVDAAFVRSIIRGRRLRDQFFRGELFADPAFDMLLDLYAARLEGSRVAVSSLCIAAAVPATTALRWIRQLTEKGLFVRTADPQDGRRVYIGLSDDAARAMGRYLAAVQRAGLPSV
jgi:hypothetical protein